MKASTGSAGQAAEQATATAGEAKTGDATPLTEEELKKKAEEEAAKAVEKPAGGSG